MSRIKKTTGFVIRSIDYGDTSRIICVLSRDFGKVSFIAKGARRIESKFGASLELLTLSEFVFYEKEGLKLLSEASMIDSYSQLKLDYDRLDAALGSARWIYRLLEDDHKEPSAFVLCRDFLDVLCGANGQYAFYRLSFQLKILAAMGIAPTLDRCAVCGKSPERAWFSMQKGGLLCQDCRSAADAHERPLPLGISKSLQMLLKLPFQKLGRLQASDDVALVGDKLIDEFAAHHLRPLTQQRKHLAPQ